MGKHSEPRRASPQGLLQTLQNAALPAALLIVVGVIAIASPALRHAGDEYVEGNFTSSEGIVDDDWTPSESASPKEKKQKQEKAEKLRFKAEIIRATHLKKKPEPRIPTDFVRVRRDALVATGFAVGSYNVLGFGHTAKGGNKKGWADGRTRTRWAVDQIRGHDLSVVGLQEFQLEQAATFNSIAGGEYAVYPGAAGGRSGVQNSIAWRRAEWQVVEARTIDIPYLSGGRMPMPYVLLRHLGTGQLVWFANFHNPADARGPAQGARNAAMSMQVNLFNELGSGGLPVISTGDFNERDEVLCRFAASAGMTSADGGYADASGCHAPARMQVDWIFGTRLVSFSNYLADRSPYVARTSDHPLVRADALIAPPFVAETCLARSRESTFVFCPPNAG